MKHLVAFSIVIVLGAALAWLFWPLGGDPGCRGGSVERLFTSCREIKP